MPFRKNGASPLSLYTCAVLLSLLGVLAGLPRVAVGAETNQSTVILVVGAAGEPDFMTNFVRQVELWTNACARGHARAICIGLADTNAGMAVLAGSSVINAPTSDRDRLSQILAAEPREAAEPLWLVFIGHGTFDGKEARFNLRGPDVTATELREWLRPFSRPIIFIDTASASAPFLTQLSATNHVIISATRSGNEQNFARFGLYFAEALADPGSDLDQDGQTSVLEAFISASVRTAEFYKSQGRLATEHALLDDNGDGLGTPADWFRGVRPIKKPEGAASVDGARAHQFHLVLSQAEQELPPDIRAKRDQLELAIARLRETKSQRPEAEYYRDLEKLLMQLQQAYGEHL